MKAVRKVFDGENWAVETVRKATPLLRPALMPEFHNGRRVYTIASRRFSIVAINRPAAGDIVYFTDREWGYLQSQDLSPENFVLVWNLKKENYHYSPIPEEVENRTRAAGMAACRNVLELLKKKSSTEA